MECISAADDIKINKGHLCRCETGSDNIHNEHPVSGTRPYGSSQTNAAREGFFKL